MITSTDRIVRRRLPNTDTQNPPTFESLLPAIKRMAGYAFRRVRRCLREDLIAETVGRAYLAFVRLFERGLTALIYPTALAKFAIRQVRDCRCVGSRRTVSDALSEYAQRRKSFRVMNLGGKESEPWYDQLLVDRRATPAELVAWKLDFGGWLQRLSHLQRLVALRLAFGDRPSEVARRFGVSRSRISQLRRELQNSWEGFQASSV
jgi:hypothetical protein